MTSQDFEMFSGDSKVLNVSVTDAAGEAVDLTGASIKWQAAKLLSMSSVVVTKESGSGIEITDATGGLFSITLDPEDTAALSGRYLHEAEVTDSDGNVATVFSGRMTITPDIIQ